MGSALLKVAICQGRTHRQQCDNGCKLSKGLILDLWGRQTKSLSPAVKVTQELDIRCNSIPCNWHLPQDKLIKFVCLCANALHTSSWVCKCVNWVHCQETFLAHKATQVYDDLRSASMPLYRRALTCQDLIPSAVTQPSVQASVLLRPHRIYPLHMQQLPQQPQTAFSKLLAPCGLSIKHCARLSQPTTICCSEWCLRESLVCYSCTQHYHWTYPFGACLSKTQGN